MMFRQSEKNTPGDEREGRRPNGFLGLSLNDRTIIQSSAKRWSLGCVTRPRAKGGPGGEITQPRAHLIADLCIPSDLIG